MSYQIQEGNKTRWMEFEQMIDEIDLVIDYEKRRKDRYVWGKEESNKEK